MKRDLNAEVDMLKQEMTEIKTLMQQLLAERQRAEIPCVEEDAPRGAVQKMPGMHPDPAVMRILDALENQCNRENLAGCITYMGVYASGGRQSTWIRKDQEVDSLLTLIEDHSAERILACIGSRERLSLLLAILRRPRTVAQIVEECGFSSAGQVYHHMKPLIAADLIAEDDREKGRYVIRPHRVQGIIMLLAGIRDMLSPECAGGK